MLNNNAQLMKHLSQADWEEHIRPVRGTDIKTAQKYTRNKSILGGQVKFVKV